MECLLFVLYRRSEGSGRGVLYTRFNFNLGLVPAKEITGHWLHVRNRSEESMASVARV